MIKNCKIMICLLPVRAGGYCSKHYNYFYYRTSHKRKKQHRMTKSPEYKSWQSMKSRCLNPKATGYEYWGGRGIKICDRWLNSFENFLADMGKRPEGATLNRIDNDGNYEPQNCKWSFISEQQLNKRIQKNNRSGYKHIHYIDSEQRKKKWVVSISYNGKQHNIGRYTTLDEAIIARDTFYNKYVTM